MNKNLQRLAKDTAIYGLSSIVGRFLNYLLVPLYTAKISAASGGYGVITNMYAYTALILVLLTFGMETTYFRFTNKTHEDSMRVYSTTLIAVGMVSLTFVAMVLLLIFAFWVCVPLLVIGLFAGFRYSFSGAELGRESINHAMDKAAEAADRVMGEIRTEDRH